MVTDVMPKACSSREGTKGFTKKEKQEGHLAGQRAYKLVVFLSSS
jgi:hypothetical protein